jgi:4-diphosphocytidyl-2-C-methyl-D-erythritol kinase
VLRALDALAPNPLGTRLVELASSIGADVPFLSIESPMALAWSRGERLLPLHPLEPHPVVLLIPDVAISTVDAYGWLAAARGSYSPEARVIAPEMLATWEAVAGVASNDFERVVAAKHPEIAELVDELASFDAAISMLSGSGSAVFGVFDAPPDVAAIARSTGRSPIVARTADRVVRVEVAA